MLVPLGHTYIAYRAHLVSGLLNAHDVEAHVQHDRSALFYGGAGCITATVWIPNEAWDEAWEVLTAKTDEADLEAMVAADAVGPDYAGRRNLPSMSSVLLGTTMLWLGVNLLLTLGTVTIQWMPGGRQDIGRSLAALPFAVFVLVLESLLYGLIVSVVCAMTFPFIALFQNGTWPWRFVIGSLILLVAFLKATSFSSI